MILSVSEAAPPKRALCARLHLRHKVENDDDTGAATLSRHEACTEQGHRTKTGLSQDDLALLEVIKVSAHTLNKMSATAKHAPDHRFLDFLRALHSDNHTMARQLAHGCLMHIVRATTSMFDRGRAGTICVIAQR